MILNKIDNLIEETKDKIKLLHKFKKTIGNITGERQLTKAESIITRTSNRLHRKKNLSSDEKSKHTKRIINANKLYFKGHGVKEKLAIIPLAHATHSVYSFANDVDDIKNVNIK